MANEFTINVWLGCHDDFNELIIQALDDENYDGPLSNDVLEVFGRMSDKSAVLPLFQKNSQYTLWNTYFSFDEDDMYQYPVITEPDPPIYPVWEGGARPVYPVEPIPVGEDGIPLFSRAKIKAPKKLPEGKDETPEETAEREAQDAANTAEYDAAVAAQAQAIDEWENTLEFFEWELEVTAYKDAEKDWQKDRKDYEDAYDVVDKPYRKAIADLEAEVKKLGKAYEKTDTAVQGALDALPGDLKVLGAWFFDDGGQAMPLDADLIKYMPDVPDTFNPDGTVKKYKGATEIVDINLSAGQAPRDFS